VPYDIAKAFIVTAADRCSPPFSHDSALEKVQRAYGYQQKQSTQDWRRQSIQQLVKEHDHDDNA
jgi:hypothetical protein